MVGGGDHDEPGEHSGRSSTTNSTSESTVHGSVLQIGRADVVSLAVPSAGIAHLEDPDLWPYARIWDPLEAGTHPARSSAGGERVPPYVERDIDARLRARVGAAAENGGFVLVLGHSAAGKTRAAFEAVRSVLPDHRVVAPSVGAELPIVLRTITKKRVRCVLWLDDLEDFLGPNALDQRTLAQYMRLRVPIIATMSVRSFEIFNAAARERDDASTALGAIKALRISERVLEMAEPIEVPRIWSESEIERARMCDDDRIADAVGRHGPYGVAEYLAAGPAIWSEWRRSMDIDGQPRGAALVAAAVDLARTGLPGPYAEELIVDLHEHYLEEQGGYLLRPEPLTDAFAWASRKRFGVTSPLLPVKARHWGVFDYLVDGMGRLSPCPPVPDHVWRRVLEEAPRDELMSIAVYAAEAGTATSFEIAERVWSRVAAADAGPASALAAYNMGVLCMENDRRDEARVYFRRGAEQGEPKAAYNLSVMLNDDGDHAEALRWSKNAAESGYPPAFFLVGAQLEEQGFSDEAEVWYRRGAQSGDHRSATNLGRVMCESGRVDEAQPWFQLAERSGDQYATFNIGRFHHDAGRLEQAEYWYEVAFERGLPEGAFNRGALCLEKGDSAGAEVWFRRAFEAGLARAGGSLGNVFRTAGRDEEAEEWYRRAAECGHVDSAKVLAAILYRSGRSEESLAWLRRAMALGDRDAAAILGEVLEELGRVDEAIEPLTVAADAGNLDAAYNLGAIFANRGEVEGALRWYRRAAEGGDTEAAMNLADVLFREGRVASAVWWGRRARKLRAEARQRVS
ncbi:tetratricopeptide repeat protein [Streptoalloteichus tenebrarius]|uniref:tetratricopeptide repeat protein n=1 Tax=Streptoalloteichus tenebrarius (strain ATCC 17920 / DSM 40477 / JCM 4838 / CBS 697.72 / NBRC 16177 / NCIMB 11028 / NRRL B-12390 / A12253. 1 / ISP 5477) TaxID=1933 RepID=UPI0020A4699A|nr:tetratricopeptide repeat protein [Streptoalloteichus tenebrarius]